MAKIYSEEILPMFLNQTISNELRIYPVYADIKRYQFSIRMVKKFLNDKIEIIEDKPKMIKIIKK